MERSAANAKADKSQKADSSKESALRIRPVVDKGNELGDPLRELVPSRGCRGSACSPFMESVAQRMASMPAAQRRQAAMALQKSRGNRFVQRMATRMQSSATVAVPMQAKLAVGPAADEYEREADWIANQVMSMPELETSRACPLCNEEDAVQRAPMANQITPLVERPTVPEEEEEIQTKLLVSSAGTKGGLAGSEFEQSLEHAWGSGQPLAEVVRDRMQSTFGADFSSVRIHSDEQADRLNRSIQARAFTTGQDIFFRQGEYWPSSSEGQRLLAHELTHVMQQNDSRLERAQTLLIKKTYPLAKSFVGNRSVDWASRLDKKETMDIQSNQMNKMNKEKIPTVSNDLSKLQNKTTTVQRMVAVAKKEMSGNFVELTSINYALTKGSGKPPVDVISKLDFKDIKEDDELWIIAHGRPGESGDYKGDEIADFLTKKPNGLKNGQKFKGVSFTSCYAGVKPEGDFNSVVKTVKDRLSEINVKVPVKGSLGMSVKSEETGSDFSVIKTDKESEEHEQKIEQFLKKIYDPEGKAESIKKKLTYNPKTAESAQIENVAKGVSKETGKFYKELVKALNNPSKYIAIIIEHLSVENFAKEQEEAANSLIDYLLEKNIRNKLTIDKGKEMQILQ